MPHVCMLFVVCGVGLSRTSKQNELPLFTFDIISKANKSKEGQLLTPHFIPLKLEPPFPNDDSTRKIMIDLGFIQMNSLVEGCFRKRKPRINSKHAYTTSSMCTHKGFKEPCKESF